MNFNKKSHIFCLYGAFLFQKVFFLNHYDLFTRSQNEKHPFPTPDDEN
jgi:hypothetical protein